MNEALWCYRWVNGISGVTMLKTKVSSAASEVGAGCLVLALLLICLYSVHMPSAYPTAILWQIEQVHR